MRVGIVSVYVDYHRRGRRNALALQPQIGPLLAGLLPADIEIEIINETVRPMDFSRHYDLVFLSALHSDFDRARQISHYYRRRGATTVFGGAFASTYPQLALPYFDAIVVGDPETTVPALYQDFSRRQLQRVYRSSAYAGDRVPTPRFDLMPDGAPLSFALEASRGCPFSCEFCVLSGLGTRYETRTVERVVADVRNGLHHAARRRVPRRLIGFTDNNLGGSLSFLRELCAALKPLGIQWYCAVTFNVIANRELVRLMSEAGCMCVFVGLESFNPAALADMHKYQNAAHKTRAAIDTCREHGILVISGLMLSPQIDTIDYIHSLPRRVRESGLHVPTFLCFESPIPGTPHFNRLAAEPGAFLPNALLRDFTGYTLVTRPHHASVDDFVGAYRGACREIFSTASRLRKLVEDVPYFLRARRPGCAIVDAADMIGLQGTFPPPPTRSLVAGSDTPPPERVPLSDADFESDAQRSAILDPWQVTDEHGRVLRQWLLSQQPFAGEMRRARASTRNLETVEA
ncbi:MAG: radical SAM protein [Rhodocyclaceae bacterium]|nr:radical SAM protein [Rhodocyclaceae bacterium]